MLRFNGKKKMQVAWLVSKKIFATCNIKTSFTETRKMKTFVFSAVLWQQKNSYAFLKSFLLYESL